MAYKYEEYQAVDTELVPILVDNLEHAQEMERKYARSKFPIFYDQSNSIAKTLNQQVVWWKLGRMPGMLLVDKQGIIQFAYYSDSMADIPKHEDVMDVLQEIRKKEGQ